MKFFTRPLLILELVTLHRTNEKLYLYSIKEGLFLYRWKTTVISVLYPALEFFPYSSEKSVIPFFVTLFFFLFLTEKARLDSHLYKVKDASFCYV